jgi:hypothetical protein
MDSPPLNSCIVTNEVMIANQNKAASHKSGVLRRPSLPPPLLSRDRAKRIEEMLSVGPIVFFTKIRIRIRNIK